MSDVLFVFRPTPSAVLTGCVNLGDVGWPPSLTAVCPSPWSSEEECSLPNKSGCESSVFPFLCIRHVAYISLTHPAQDVVDSNPRSPPPPPDSRLSGPRTRARQTRETSSCRKWRDQAGRVHVQPAHTPQENMVCRYPVYCYGQAEEMQSLQVRTVVQLFISSSHLWFREFGPAWDTVAKAWAKTPTEHRNSHFFGTIDFDNAQSVFQRVSCDQ